MKHFTKQKKMSNNGILSTDGAIRRWLSLLPLMVLMMWLVPTGLRAQVYDNSVTYTALDTYYLQPSAVYNTKTNVLTFKMRDITHELGTDETLVADFYDPAVNANWFNGTKNKFYWSDDVKNAVTKVVIEKNFSNYALPSCKGMFEEFNKGRFY